MPNDLRFYQTRLLLCPAGEKFELELDAEGEDSVVVGDGLDLPVNLRRTLLSTGVVGSPLFLRSGSTIDFAPRHWTGNRNPHVLWPLNHNRKLNYALIARQGNHV